MVGSCQLGVLVRPIEHLDVEVRREGKIRRVFGRVLGRRQRVLQCGFAGKIDALRNGHACKGRPQHRSAAIVAQ